MGEMKLGSLFDGSGGFPLAACLCGITPVWASEIEPYPIAVTQSQFPEMEHLGDISRVNGAEIEPVDIITFGSPCQDMSVAGRRDGLDGSRSGLFYEAVRIIKEMRCATGGKYPRYIVWENVPGAFSSNKGEDFRAVLEAVIGIVQPDTQVPMPEKAKWPHADCYMGDGWSVAYRTLDAQYWGVPQRRRRIYLVADFGGRRAEKILFEREGLSGYSADGIRSWQRVAGSLETCVRASSLCLNDQGGNRMDVSEGVTGTLRAQDHGHPPLVFENHAQDSRYTGPLNAAATVVARYGTGGNNLPFVVDTPKTLKIRSGCEGGGKGPGDVQNGYSARKLTPTECARLQGFPDWWATIPKKENFTDEKYEFWKNVRNTHATINGKTTKDYTKQQMLTWYSKLHTDSSEYKMWGNGIALPTALYVMQGISEEENK